MKERIAQGFQNKALWLGEVSVALQSHDGKHNRINFFREIVSFVLIVISVTGCELATIIDPSLAT